MDFATLKGEGVPSFQTQQDRIKRPLSSDQEEPAGEF
jgi:hypothetical protein